MALLRNIGPLTTIAAGATHLWEYWFNSGDEVGVAFVTPNMQEEAIVELIARDPGSLQIAGVGEGGNRIHYTIRIFNNSSTWMDYNLNIGNLL